tara:strand:+ start:4620 stop:4970 length:351 start_codon:yes stop_codon:yes gene_type:complete
MKVASLYVAAKDFERAKKCYSELVFEREPSSTTDRFAFYDIDGFQFGIFDPSITGEQPKFGDNTVPTIEVDKADEVYARLLDGGLESVLKPQDVNETRVCQVRDTEGNVLEFFTWL